MSNEEPTAPEERTDEEPSVDEATEAADGTTEDRESADGDLDGRAGRIEELEAELDEREERIDELESRLKRTQADFQNYKKRAKKRQEQLENRATEDLVTRLLDVRDNLVRALDQDEDAAIRDGVDATLREFDRVLDDEAVSEVAPEPGSEVDPQRHEVMLRVESEQPEDSVAEVYTPGYEMAGKVLRPAQVTVSDGTEE
jgi:molecular chaperone GrpE